MFILIDKTTTLWFIFMKPFLFEKLKITLLNKNNKSSIGLFCGLISLKYSFMASKN